MADVTQGLPDIQSILGSVVSQIGPNMQATSNQMGALQDYIKGQQKDQLNIPALQFAAGLLKPTKTGSFAESVGEAGSGALESLQKQRGIDLDRQSKILELQQAKGALLMQQAQAWLPFAQMQANGAAADSAFGGTSTGLGVGSAQTGVDASGIPDPLSRYRALIKNGIVYKNPEALTAAKLMTENDPSLRAAIAGQVKGAEATAADPHELVDTMIDGAPAKVPRSVFLRQATPTAAPAPAVGAPVIASAVAPVTPAAAPLTAPAVDPESGNVHSVVPAPPPGGGLPMIPQGATGLPPGYADQAKAAAEVPKEWAKDSGDLDTMKNRFRELNYLGKIAESNQWATQKAAIAAHLKALALQYDPNADVSKIDADKWGKPAETQQTIKDVTQLAMAAARAQSSRGTNMVLQEAMLTTPQADMQPAARWTLINHGIAAIDRRQQMMADWQAAQAKGWKDPNVFERQWLKANPIDPWIQSTSEKAGNFAGMPLPEKLRVGVTYVSPKGRKHAGELGVWNGKSFDAPDANNLSGLGAN